MKKRRSFQYRNHNFSFISQEGEDAHGKLKEMGYNLSELVEEHLIKFYKKVRTKTAKPLTQEERFLKETTRQFWINRGQFNGKTYTDVHSWLAAKENGIRISNINSEIEKAVKAGEDMVENELF